MLPIMRISVVLISANEETNARAINPWYKLQLTATMNRCYVAL